MSKIDVLSSTSQLSSVLSKNTVVVIDFHATWCGPCKAIAPTFESLAQKHAASGKVAFAKCDVDACQEIAGQYGVRAMPTFLILKNRVEVARVQGADPRSLTSAVEKYAGEAKSAGATFATSGKGYTLGSTAATAAAAAAAAAGAAGAGAGAGSAGARYVRNGQVLDSMPVPARLRGFFNAFVVFVGLYLTSLFSLDAIPAAENSPFNITRGAEAKANVRSARGPGHAAPSPGGPAGRRLGTLDSIRGGGG